MNNLSYTSPYVEISLDNCIHNFFQIKNSMPESLGIIAVVKDNAYGCGSVPISRVLEQHGAQCFAVAKPHEAYALRNGGISLPIVVLGPAAPMDILCGAAKNISFTLNDINDIALWKSLNCPVHFHVKVDTGMGRMGILPDQADALVQAIANEPLLMLEGVFTHCANADAPDTASISRQLVHFRKVVQTLTDKGIYPHYIHYGNSSTIMRFPLEECTMVRPGITLYGCKPDPKQEWSLDVKPVFSLKARIVKVKLVPAGTAISYGSTYITGTPTTIATIALGYGQGYPRKLSNKGFVIIRGKKYPLAGRVTMDYIMVDIGAETDISVGDEVVAIGCMHNECITPDDVALLCDTIGYEIMCNVSPLIDRYYLLGNTIVYHEPARAI